MSFEKLTDSLWKLQIIGWLIYFVLMFLTFLSVETTETLVQIFFIKVQRTLTGFVLTCLLWQFYKWILDLQSFGKNITIIFFSSVLFGIVWTAIETFYLMQTLPGFDVYKSLPGKPRVALVYTVTIMAWSAIYLGIIYWQQMQNERENALEAKVLAEKARLEMLRYQVNPHFLFNAMNSIRALINEDNQPAKNMITQLSEFLRHSLLSNEQKEVPLREELEAVKNYLAIEKIRFEETLEIEFDVDKKAKGFKVPCFLLNPLIENAVKHGFPASPELLKIKVSAKLNDEKLLIEVANTGNLVQNPNSNGTKIGLNNVRERLEKLFPDKGTFKLFEENGFVIARIEINK